MKNTLVINLDRCSGCDSCITTCKFENSLPLGEYFSRVISIGPTGIFPDIEQYWLPVQCQQCENPQCVAVCPTGASYRDTDTNVVLINQDACIGCQYCILACPYGVRTVSEETGVAQKCTLCSQLTASGADLPPCVHNCPTGGRFFGDLDDPNSDVSAELAKYSGDCIHSLPDPNNSKPSTRYILSPSIASWKGLV